MRSHHLSGILSRETFTVVTEIIPEARSLPTQWTPRVKLFQSKSPRINALHLGARRRNIPPLSPVQNWDLIHCLLTKCALHSTEMCYFSLAPHRNKPPLQLNTCERRCQMGFCCRLTDLPFFVGALWRSQTLSSMLRRCGNRILPFYEKS